jgi:hypothetical protein
VLHLIDGRNALAGPARGLTDTSQTQESSANALGAVRAAAATSLVASLTVRVAARGRQHAEAATGVASTTLEAAKTGVTGSDTAHDSAGVLAQHSVEFASWDKSSAQSNCLCSTLEFGLSTVGH